MSEGYPLRPLGDVMSLDVERMPMEAGTKYHLAGVLNAGKGLIDKGEFDGAATDYTAMNVLRTDQVVMRKLTAWEGPITVVPEEFDGHVVSNEFPTFALAPDVVPAWMRLVCGAPRLWAEMKSRVSGTVQRRKRLNPDQLLQIEFPIPPLAMQRRIVEVIGAVDDQIAALEAEAIALRALIRRRREELVNDASLEEKQADAVFEITMGRQRSPKRATGPDMTDYLRSANVGYGRLDLSDVLRMDFSPAEQETFSLQVGDVLVSEGSASETAVGMPAMWRGELSHTVCFQNTLLRYRAIDGISVPAFVAHWCLWAYESGRFRDVAGGTNIKHIGAKRAALMAVRLPRILGQQQIAAELDALSECAESTHVEATRLRAMRRSLLSALLNREVEISDLMAEFEFAAERPTGAQN